MSIGLKFKLDSRSFSGDTYRPTPEILIDEVNSMLICSTPWGPRSLAQKSNELIQSQFLALKNDHDITRNIGSTSVEKSATVNLEAALQFANRKILREENLTEVVGGCEVFAMVLQDGELSFAQIGGPHLILSRTDNKSPIHLGTYMDLASDLSQERDLMPGLPANPLGISEEINVLVNSFCPRPNDRIVLLSHSLPPTEIFQKGLHFDLDSATRVLAEAQPHHAFWIGTVTLEVHQEEEDDVELAG